MDTAPFKIIISRWRGKINRVKYQKCPWTHMSALLSLSIPHVLPMPHLPRCHALAGEPLHRRHLRPGIHPALDNLRRHHLPRHHAPAAVHLTLRRLIALWASTAVPLSSPTPSAIGCWSHSRHCVVSLVFKSTCVLQRWHHLRHHRNHRKVSHLKYQRKLTWRFKLRTPLFPSSALMNWGSDCHDQEWKRLRKFPIDRAPFPFKGYRFRPYRFWLFLNFVFSNFFLHRINVDIE